MKFKHFVFYFFFTFLVFLFYFFNRSFLLGADTPAFLSVSCQHTTEFKILPVSELVFSMLPCNLVFFKILACLIFLSCVLICSEIGVLAWREKGWVAGLFCFLNFGFFQDLLKLEEQSFAFPFVFASFYFLIRFVLEKKSWFLLYSIVLFGVSGLFWKGTIFYVFLLAFFSVFFAIILVPLFLFLLPKFINYFSQGFKFSGLVVAENLPGFGVVLNSFLLFGLNGLRSFKPLFFAGLSCVFLSFLALKYSVYCVPLLIFGFTLLLKKNPRWLFPACCVSVLFFVVQLLNMPTFFPSNELVEGVKSFSEIARFENKRVLNDFGYGWLLKFFGVETNYFASFPNPNFQKIEDALVVSSTELKNENCVLLFQKQAFFYDCS